MDDTRFEELAAEHALGRLEGADAEAFAAECARRGPSAEAVLRRQREVLAALALAVPPEAPPPEVRDRLLAALDGEARGTVTPLRSRATPWRAAAAVLAAIAVGLAAWASALRSDRERLATDLADARGQLAAADSAAAAERRGLEVAAAPAGQLVSLAGTGEEPGASARVFLDPATGRAILFAYDLPILPPDTVYELWAIRGATPQPAGTFVVDEGGRARLEIADPSLVTGIDAFAVTVEPAPGVPAPTGPMVLVSGT